MGTGTIIERIKKYLSEPKIMEKDTVEAAVLLHEVLETMVIKPNKAGAVEDGGKN